MSASSSESRSQHENVAVALRRLRAAFALELREPVGDDWAPPEVLVGLVQGGPGRIGDKTRRSGGYLAAMAALLDLLAAEAFSPSRAARRLGVSTGALARFLRSDSRLSRKLAELRAKEAGRPRAAPEGG